MLIKNERIARFPNMPKDQKDHINMHCPREIVSQDKLPWTAVDVTKEGNVQPVPDTHSSPAFSEDVEISFKHTRALLAPGLLQRLYIPMEEMCMGVQTSMEEKPRKKLNFGG